MENSILSQDQVRSILWGDLQKPLDEYIYYGKGRLELAEIWTYRLHRDLLKMGRDRFSMKVLNYGELPILDINNGEDLNSLRRVLVVKESSRSKYIVEDFIGERVSIPYITLEGYTTESGISSSMIPILWYRDMEMVKIKERVEDFITNLLLKQATLEHWLLDRISQKGGILKETFLFTLNGYTITSMDRPSERTIGWYGWGDLALGASYTQEK